MPMVAAATTMADSATQAIVPAWLRGSRPARASTPEMD
jgi:hypothetical protein